MAIPYIPPQQAPPSPTPDPQEPPTTPIPSSPSGGSGFLGGLMRHLFGQGWQAPWDRLPQQPAAPANWAQMAPLEQIQWWRSNPTAWIPAADGGRGDWRWAHMNTYDYERNKYLDDLARAYTPQQQQPIPTPYGAQPGTATAPGFLSGRPAEWDTLPPELKRRWWDDWRAKQTQTGD